MKLLINAFDIILVYIYIYSKATSYFRPAEQLYEEICFPHVWL